MLKDKKNITIYDIAREAGVSASLVSRVISGNGSVSEKNRMKIQKLIDKYNFRPNAIARGLQKSRSRMIGFVLPHISTEYFSSTYYEFEKRASKAGYMTILCNGKSDPEVESKILRTLEETRVEAIIFMGGRADLIGVEDEYIDELRKVNKSIPCIVCSSRAEMFDCIGIHGDDYIGVNKLMAHLAQQGYKSLAILGGTDQSHPSKVKKQYFKEAAIRYGMEIRNEWIIGNSFNPEDGAEAMKQLLKQSHIPEVACCINDHVAVGAINVALDAGLVIPDDIAITGYDGVEASILSRPHITTVCPNYSEYGETIFQAMTALMEGREFEKLTLIEPEIIIRSSSLRYK
ncbi:MAG: LacI family transcriptional regulator [Clostridiales bacterium]|jgi:LacI family transcriptional regulator/LacI family purine nucleotide synthesis repressor/LacI family repressor for deo operon, udp, cdd, tsx, nupC, and nupG|nr:LacI family transcriptional regulator [Clostridiales bacterium]